MLEIAPIQAIGNAAHASPAVAPPLPMAGNSQGFGDILAAGLQNIDARVAHADALVLAYAQGEAIPVHQVTLALEQARLAVDLAVAVRSKLIETYRDFMGMQI